MAKAAVRAAAAGAVVALLTAGFAACTPTAPSLACKVVPSSTRPEQLSKETVTVKTAAGAKVVTIARWKGSSTSWLHFANKAGHATAVYDVGRATIGYPVKVYAFVAKGRQQGACLTTFTPVARRAGHKPTLSAPPLAPGVALTTGADKSIHLTWGAHSAGVTGFRVSLVSQNGLIRSGTYAATTKNLDTTFNGPLGTACDPLTFPDHVTATVVAVKNGVQSEATTLTKQMPRLGAPLPTGVTVNPGSGQVSINGNFACPVVNWGFVRTNPAAYTTTPGRLGTAHIATVARGDYAYFSVEQCSQSGVCSDEVHSARTFVTGPIYPTGGVSGVCEPATNSILWSWNPGNERGLNSRFAVNAGAGWTSGTTQPNDYNLRSTRGSAINGTFSVTVTALSSDGQVGTPVVGTVTCSDPTTVTPPPVPPTTPPPPVTPSPSPSISPSPSASPSPSISPSPSPSPSASPSPSPSVSASPSASGSAAVPLR